MTLINVPGCDVTTVNDKACNLAAYLDRAILGTNHIWEQSKVLDPEGLLSTLPAIATTLLGVLTGQWLRSGRANTGKFAGMLGSGIVLTLTGWIWSFGLPLNKSLWTSSFVVYTAGLALCFLAGCYWLVDLEGYRKWSTPFLIFGSNAIALFVGSTIVGKTLDIVELSAPNDQTIFLQEKIFNVVFLPLADAFSASFLYAISFVLISLLLMWQLYRKKIFIKV
jgi:predicted acyltransferase